MSIVIGLVEDDDSKALRIQEALMASHGLSMHRMRTATEARNWLTKNRADLLILDVVLPNRPDSTPKFESGLDLLREIADGDAMFSPRYMVGLTEYADIASEYAREFDEFLWTLVFYDRSSNSWSNSLERMVDHIQAVDKQEFELGFGVDVCVVAALRDPELVGILSMPWDWKSPKPFDSQTFVYEGTFTRHDKALTVVAANAPRMGCVASALLTQRLLERYRPRVLLMTGICAGIAGKAAIGDVVVASVSWDWQSGKHAIVDGNSQFDIDPDQIHCSSQITSSLELLNMEALARAAQACTHASPKDWRPKVLIGPMASGSAVLANEELLKIVKKQNRKVVAVDMECYGVYAAAARYSVRSPIFATIKVVSDLGDQNKERSEEYRAAFGYLSAKVIDHLLATLPHTAFPD